MSCCSCPCHTSFEATQLTSLSYQIVISIISIQGFIIEVEGLGNLTKKINVSFEVD